MGFQRGERGGKEKGVNVSFTESKVKEAGRGQDYSEGGIQTASCGRKRITLKKERGVWGRSVHHRWGSLLKEDA